MNQQEQEFLREKQELLEYKRICSLSELKMLCEDAERYAALDDALFLYS